MSDFESLSVDGLVLFYSVLFSVSRGIYKWVPCERPSVRLSYRHHFRSITKRPLTIFQANLLHIFRKNLKLCLLISKSFGCQLFLSYHGNSYTLWTFLQTSFPEHNSKTVKGISTKLATHIKQEG